ncbi:hypothetical protein CVN76_11165 [Bacillus sp. mrc49]|nr:hypothetical protein CVN76_11165 [Bacillus sp. mrc49]
MNLSFHVDIGSGKHDQSNSPDKDHLQGKEIHWRFLLRVHTERSSTEARDPCSELKRIKYKPPKAVEIGFLNNYKLRVVQGYVHRTYQIKIGITKKTADKPKFSSSLPTVRSNPEWVASI